MAGAPDSRRREPAGARADDAADGFGRDAQFRSGRGDRPCDSAIRTLADCSSRTISAALTQARSKEKRSVYIDSTDCAKRARSSPSYMIPMPVWKSSYRLIFGDKRAAHARRLGDCGQHDGRGLDQVCSCRWCRGGRFRLSAGLYEPRYVAVRRRNCRRSRRWRRWCTQEALDEEKAGGALQPDVAGAKQHRRQAWLARLESMAGAGVANCSRAPRNRW